MEPPPHPRACPPRFPGHSVTEGLSPRCSSCRHRTRSVPSCFLRHLCPQEAVTLTTIAVRLSSGIYLRDQDWCLGRPPPLPCHPVLRAFSLPGFPRRKTRREAIVSSHRRVLLREQSLFPSPPLPTFSPPLPPPLLSIPLPSPTFPLHSPSLPSPPLLPISLPSPPLPRW